MQLRIMGLESDLIQQSIELDELKRQNAESQTGPRPGPGWFTALEVSFHWKMPRCTTQIHLNRMVKDGRARVFIPADRKVPRFYQFTVPPAPDPASRRYFQGFMENGKLSLQEYDPAYDFKDIPRWLLEDAFFTDGSRERRNNKELLLEIARVATMRAEYGAEEARRILDGAPETPDCPTIPKLQ